MTVVMSFAAFDNTIVYVNYFLGKVASLMFGVGGKICAQQYSWMMYGGFFNAGNDEG